MALIAGLAVIIGVLLGLLGGGGSILTVPVLVYLADLPAKSAIVTSLIVVGCTSLIATISHARKKRVCWKTGAIFGGAGMLGAFIGGRLSAFIPGAVLLVLFAIIMLTASFSMLRARKPSNNETMIENEAFCPLTLPIFAILFDGFILGMITGLVGVGGGFLLVPALGHFANLPMHAAIGTSLFIIVLQTGAALLGYMNHMQVDINLTAIVTICAILGSFLGSSLTSYISSYYLKKSFGVFVFILGCFLLYKELSFETIQQIQRIIAENQAFIQGASSVIAIFLIYRLWLWIHTLKVRL